MLAVNSDPKLNRVLDKSDTAISLLFDLQETKDLLRIRERFESWGTILYDFPTEGTNV